MGMERLISLIFVKAMSARLKNNQSIIGDETYILRFRKRSGHEDVLLNLPTVLTAVIGASAAQRKLFVGEIVTAAWQNVRPIRRKTHLQTFPDAYACDLECAVDCDVQS